MSDWKEISSAPKGQEILIWSPRYGIAHVTWNEYAGKRLEDGECSGDWDACFNNSDGWGDAIFEDATHWCSLPEPPNERSEG